MEKLIITNSSMSCFMTCREKYDMRYNQRLSSVTVPTALLIGRAVHEGLAVLFNALRNSPADGTEKTDEVMAMTVAGNDARTGGLSDQDVAITECMVLGYCERYKNRLRTEDEADFRVVLVEEPFEIKARSPFTRRAVYGNVYFAGKIDAVIETDEGLWIMEHKTASRFDDDYFMSKEFDNQTALYAIAAREILGREVVGAVYDVLRKPMLKKSEGESDEEFAARAAASKTGRVKRKVSETVEEYSARLLENLRSENGFARRWVRFDDDFVNTKQRFFCDIARDMRKPKIYPNTSACMSGFGMCEFCGLCSAKAKNEPDCGTFRVRSKMHEELER